MNRWLLSLAALALAACATPTPYTAAQKPGAAGFSDLKIENNRYRVTARANAGPRAADIALLRAAELTLAEGASWFVVDRRTGGEAPGRRGPSVSIGVGGGSYGGSGGVGGGVGLGFPIGGGGGGAEEVLEFRTGRGEAPAGSYNAQSVAESLRPRLQ